MTKYNINKKSKKAFLRWCAKGNPEYQNAVSYTLDALLPIIEQAGFEWVEKSPDGYKTPLFMIDLERRTGNGIECITLNFDKYRKLKLSITGKISEQSSPYRRIVIGRLVKYKSEFAKASIWGISFFDLNKEKAFKKKIDKISELLPQMIDFLTDGVVGSNIWASEKKKWN